MSRVSVRGEDDLGITVSYWESLDAIRSWGEHAEHRLAQELGRSRWYEAFSLRIYRAESEASYDLTRKEDQ